MTAKQAADTIRKFALHHAVGDLPHSEMTVEALEMAISVLSQEKDSAQVELIDKNALLLKMRSVYSFPVLIRNYSQTDVVATSFIRMVAEAPAVKRLPEAQRNTPVVLCKDCADRGWCVIQDVFYHKGIPFDQRYCCAGKQENDDLRG